MTRAAVLFAPGFEEIEAVAIVDVLRRAEIEVFMAGTETGMRVVGAHDIEISVDGDLADLPDAVDAVVLPGGMPGAANLAADQTVLELLRRNHADGGLAAAVCAGPMALAAAGLLDGVKATCYPGFESCLAKADITGERVQVDGRIVTGKGPGAAIEFALTVAAELGHEEAAEKLQTGMLVAIP